MKTRLVWILAATFGIPTVEAQADWPAFLGGTQRDEQSIAVPLEWGVNEGIRWKSSLIGHGQSSPVVVGDRVFLTAIDGPQKEQNIVMCFALGDGKLLWQREFENSILAKNDPYTSRAAPTPVADADGVVAFFESGDTYALDNEGNVRWQRKLIDDYGRYEGRFGLGGSPAQLGGAMFILADNEGPSYLLALNKTTGETLWKTDRTSRTAWSSPMIVSVDGEPQIVVSSAGSLDGYAADSGEMLWSFEDVGGNTVASPVPFGDGMFLVGASPGRNGEASEGARKSNMAVRIEKTDSGFAPEVMWRNEEATSSFGSPIVYENRAYYVNRSGAVYCISAATGDLLFKARIKESTWATPIGSEGRVYFFGQTGTTTVLAAADEHQELAVNQLVEVAADGGGPGGFNAEIQYGVAPTEEGLLIRTGENLYLIGG